MNNFPHTNQPSERKSPRSISFRTSLLRSVIILILLLSLAILTVSVIGARRAVRTLCQDLVDSGTDRVETDLRRIFAPVPPILHIFQEWSAQGLLNPEKPEELNTLLLPILNAVPQLAGISIGASDGSSFLIARTNDTFHNQIVTPDTAGQSSRWIEWNTLHGPRNATIKQDAYDPRTRPWFQIAANDKEPTPTVYWTEPYPFFSTGAPGITAAIRLHDPAGRVVVISVDLLLAEVSRLSSTLEISPNGFLVVTTNDVRSIGLPRHPDLATPEQQRAGFLKNPRDLGIPLFTEASNQIREKFDLAPGQVLAVDRGLSDANQPFRWTFENKGWWTYVRPCVIENGPQLWIGVAVPEDDFLGELQEGRKYYFGLAGLALLVATFMSFKLSHRYSTPIAALTAQSDRLRTLNTARPDAVASSGIAEIEHLHDAQERMRLALDSFAKYVPSDVVRDLLEKGEAAVIGGRHTPMSILFTDIDGFTSIAESMSPQDLTKHMASYFDALLDIIATHNGTVDKLIGDAIVAFWGAPKPNANHARDSIRGALACHLKLQQLNDEWETAGLPRLPTRFGISTGDVVVGNVGSPARLSYTALGDAVNLANRLEGANNFYGTRIIASANTVEQAGRTAAGQSGSSVTLAGDDFAWRKLDKVRVKGRSEPELIYELLGTRDDVDSDRLVSAQIYEAALDLYLERRFGDALGKLNDLEKTRHDDRAIHRLIHACHDFIQNPPPDTWDGASHFTTK